MLKWAAGLAIVLAARVACGETKLLEFTAEWCQPCKQMAPAVDALARDGYTVEKVDVGAQLASCDLARRFNVDRIPTFIVIEQGREVDRIVGPTTVERLKQRLQREPAVKVEVKGQPRPAWRYERPEKHRAAVVRVFCQDDARTRSIGSGVVVRWGNRIVVLTARHVIQDARKIIVEFHTKKTCWAKPIKVDAEWDCAALELSGQPDVEPAEVELGQAAMQDENSRLESCGYGPDGQLASNIGLFRGYRRSTAKPNGPDDWMVISGHARGGDSGGPVFNQAGRVVGVLWGTDGTTVVCVQAGRVHVVLDDAISVYKEMAAFGGRQPTPPRPGPLVPVMPPRDGQCGPGGCGPGGDCEQAAAKGKPPMTLGPWRNDAVARDSEQSREISRLIELERLRQSQQQPPSVTVPPPPVEPAKADFSPILAGLVVLGAVGVGLVVAHKG
jgi:S1-C subfamily serine protease